MPIPLARVLSAAKLMSDRLLRVVPLSGREERWIFESSSNVDPALHIWSIRAVESDDPSIEATVSDENWNVVVEMVMERTGLNINEFNE